MPRVSCVSCSARISPLSCPARTRIVEVSGCTGLAQIRKGDAAPAPAGDRPPGGRLEIAPAQPNIHTRFARTDLRRRTSARSVMMPSLRRNPSASQSRCSGVHIRRANSLPLTCSRTITSRTTAPCSGRHCPLSNRTASDRLTDLQKRLLLHADAFAATRRPPRLAPTQETPSRYYTWNPKVTQDGATHRAGRSRLHFLCDYGYKNERNLPTPSVVHIRAGQVEAVSVRSVSIYEA